MAKLMYNDNGTWEEVGLVTNNLTTASGTLPITKGGTGATNSSQALSNLGGFSSHGGTITGDTAIQGNLEVETLNGYQTFTPCGISAYCNTVVGTGLTTNTKVPMTNILSQYGSGLGISNGNITIAQEGYYLVSGSLMIADGTNRDKYLGITLTTGSGNITDYYTYFAGNYGCMTTSTVLYHFNANSSMYMEARVSGSGGATINSNTRNRITVIRVF